MSSPKSDYMQGYDNGWADALKEKREKSKSATAVVSGPTPRELDLAMAVRRFVSSARRNCEDESNVLKLANEAWSLLVRQGLEGSPLRDAGIESDPPQDGGDA